MIPEKIGRYQIEDEIGRGGMATVFKAYDPRFERHVAVKVLPREFMHDPEFRARFKREAKTIATLEHPAIVPVYDYGEDNGLLYLVMRYMPGGSLADKLENGPLSIEESAKILQRLGSALDRAHGQGIIHRDLKPGNVLFDQYGDAFLADFGIVRVTDSASNLTASGSLVGTPMYMSPEQVYGDKELDGRSDIYALGIILFQMLTGHLPYEADTPAKLMMKHILDPVPDLLVDRPDLPVKAEAVVSRALAKERDDRFDTASDFSSALSAATKETPISAEFRQQLAATQTDIAAETEETISPDIPTKPAAEIPSTAPLAAAASATPFDEVPPELADDVLEEMDVSTVQEKPAHTANPSERKNLAWVLALIGILLAACIGICVIGVIAFNQMKGEGTFVEWETAVSSESSESNKTPTPAAFPLLDADEAAQATKAASANATREQVAAAATLEAENAPVENTPETDSISPVEATRESRLATRNAAVGDTTATSIATEVDVAATRAALAEARNASTVPFPIPPVYGPANGELLHEADANLESIYTDTNLSNFVARAVVLNPYATSEGGWDFGLIFRQEAVNDELRLVVRSDGVWNLNDRSEDEDNFVQDGDLSDYLDISAGGRNEMMLAAFDEVGLFFLNGHLIAKLDLSAQDDFGEVALGTGFYTANKQTGAATAYKKFTVWPLVPEFGPRDGLLEHLDDGFIKMEGAAVNLQNFIVEAEFVNPYGEDVGTWDWGFAFREMEDEYWLIVDSTNIWTLISRSANDDNNIAKGNLDTVLQTGDGETNHIFLIALNNHGYFFLNDQFIAELDLSERLEAGDIKVVTAFFEGDEVPDYTTEYDDFTVWPLP
mgnify:CR=1 FL=1